MPLSSTRSRLYAAVLARARWVWSRVRPGSALAYGLALIFVGLAYLVRAELQALVGGPLLIFPTFFVAIALASMVGGFLPGLLAALLSFAIAWANFAPAAYAGMVNAAIFVVCSVFVAACGGLFRAFAADLLRAEVELAAARDRVQQSLSESVHRTRNLLAVMNAVMRHTAREAPDVPTLLDRMGDRFVAMGRAQQMLVGERDAHADLALVIDSAVAPFARLPGFRVKPGPGAPVRAETVTSLALALHELATNALKYGGLSESGGGVELSWRTDTHGVVHIDWIEQGAAPDRPPTEGKGSPLIRGALSAEHDGAVLLGFAPTGLQCRMRFRPHERRATAAA